MAQQLVQVGKTHLRVESTLPQGGTSLWSTKNGAGLHWFPQAAVADYSKRKEASCEPDKSSGLRRLPFPAS